jgi:hypothetical protein
MRTISNLVSRQLISHVLDLQSFDNELSRLVQYDGAHGYVVLLEDSSKEATVRIIEIPRELSSNLSVRHTSAIGTRSRNDYACH